MKHFWIKIALLLPLPLLVIGFNWWVDPVHLRGAHQYEYGIARLILDGKPVTNISHPNEEAYLQFIVAGLKSPKDVLVFGSSRSKLIRAAAFAGRSFFNCSLSGGSLTDYIALYQMYRQKQLRPTVAILELSPWILTPGHSSIWKTLNAQGHELEKALLSTTPQLPARLDCGGEARSDWKEFLSLGYFQTSFYTWLNRLRHPVKQTQNTYFVWQSDTLPVGETVLADGSVIYPDHVQHPPDRERVTALAVEYAKKPGGFNGQIDPVRQKIFEAFLDQLAQDQVRVVLYLPPYHPRAYALMMDSVQFRSLATEQQYFEDVARRKGLTLAGSYNPADLGLDQSAFFDGSHPTEETVRIVLAAALSRSGLASATKPTDTDRIEMGGVTNPNGLEVVNGKPFFWIGQGETCLSLRAPRNGVVRLTFHGDPGPSLPTTAIRKLEILVTGGYSQTVTLTNYPQVEIVVPVLSGSNEIRLTPLDTPTVLVRPNGDRRTLLLGVSDLRAQLLPVGTALCNQIPIAWVSGWHTAEHTGPDWLCWNTGRGCLSVAVSSETLATLSGEVFSAPRPNEVDVILNGVKVTSWRIDWTKWEFHRFHSLDLPLKSGENTIEFVSHKPAIKVGTDSRDLSVAVKNLRLTTAGK